MRRPVAVKVAAVVVVVVPPLVLLVEVAEVAVAEVEQPVPRQRRILTPRHLRQRPGPVRPSPARIE